MIDKNTLNNGFVSREELNKLFLDKQGYLFDSLVFRFKEYQEKAFQSDLYDLTCKGFTDREAHKKVRDAHNRDLMRFIQILDEVIGEHN